MSRSVFANAAFLLLACCGPSSDPAPNPPPPAPPPPGVVIREVALFQAVKVPLVVDGAQVDRLNAPVIAGRPALVRVYPDPEKGWRPREIIAELHLENAGKEIALQTQRMTLRRLPTDEGSPFQFDLPAELVQPGFRYSVSLRDPSLNAEPKQDTAARYPAEGTDDLHATAATATVKITLAPLKYDADDSGRIPNTTAEQLESYRKRVYKMYPTANVEMRVREPLAWKTAIGPTGDGWEEVLEAVMTAREADGAADDEYYVAVFTPARTLGEFCGREGCILGLAPLGVEADDNTAKVAAILGYSGATATSTLAHEVGHSMGREHAPCGGPDGVDPKFPYAGADIGVLGYDILENEFIPPGTARDIMGYCEPVWISDHTYAALFERIALVNASARRLPVVTEPRRYRFARIRPDGTVRLGGSITLSRPPRGEELTVEAASATTEVRHWTGHQYALERAGLRILLLPEDATSAPVLRIAGKLLRVLR